MPTPNPHSAALLSHEESQRYSRHLLLEEVGLTGQLKLKKSKVLVIGAGGLGCPCLQYLVAAGVGRIGIVEDDKVNLSNLQRQILYRSSDVGESKGAVARRLLTTLNHHCAIELFEYRFDAQQALRLIKEYDIVIDCTDNFATRYLINDSCILAAKPLIQGSVHRFMGSLTLFDNPNRGPCYRCLFPHSPQEGASGSCQSDGVVGVLPGVIGTLQATEAIKYLVGIGTSLAGRILYFDALQLSFTEYRLPKDPDCPSCGAGASIDLAKAHEAACRPSCDFSGKHEISAKQLTALDPGSYVLIDMRSAQQRAAAALPSSVALAPSDMAAHIKEQVPVEKNIILYCHSGVQSRELARDLSAQLNRPILSLKGGIAAWPYSLC
jgi:adenylyltransferase/sulfurtransferase